jgi:hypothetical protein
LVGQFRSAGGFVLLSGRKLGPWISCRSRRVTTDRSGLDVRLTKVWCSDATPLRHPGSSEIFADREAVRAKPPSIYISSGRLNMAGLNVNLGVDEGTWCIPGVSPPAPTIPSLASVIAKFGG